MNVSDPEAGFTPWGSGTMQMVSQLRCPLKFPIKQQVKTGIFSRLITLQTERHLLTI